MPNWELKFWESKFSKEPPPQERLEWMIATLTALTANINRGKGKKAKKPDQFMPFRKAFKKTLSDDAEVDADIHTMIEGFGEQSVKITPRMQRLESKDPEYVDEAGFGELDIKDEDYIDGPVDR